MNYLVLAYGMNLLIRFLINDDKVIVDIGCVFAFCSASKFVNKKLEKISL